MCRNCRIEKLERKIAFMEGRESTEPFMNAQAAKIARLEDVIVELRNDLKICHKVDGRVMLQPDHIGESFCNTDRVLASHAPVVIERHDRRDRNCSSSDGEE